MKPIWTIVTAQSMRFSTKPYDEETGLSYYGYRFYAPVLGRWLTRDPIGEKGGINLYGFAGNNPANLVDPFGLESLTDAANAIKGIPPYGTAIAGGIITSYILWENVIKPWYDAKDAGNDAKAPGKPTPDDGFEGGKDGAPWVPNPNGEGYGWRDKRGRVWCPTGPGRDAHGGPHWDVQTPDGGYVNIYPGGKVR